MFSAPAVLDPPSFADLERAARILSLRTRRQIDSFFVGSYANAFRGGGMEFEESRPYAPGDDIRNLDWNATARTGEPYVKHFREERDQLILLALDVSASMAFGSAGRSKAMAAAHAIALIAAAAGHAGDRIGLLTFADDVECEIAPDKGAAHTWRVVQAALMAARTTAGGTRLDRAVDRIVERQRRHTNVILFSDFRGTQLQTSANDARRRSTQPLAQLFMRHETVSVVVRDELEEKLPRVGLLRVSDPEGGGGTRLLNTRSDRVRADYQRAARLRARTLERSLRVAGSDLLWLDTHRDPLQVLMRFFRERAVRGRRA